MGIAKRWLRALLATSPLPGSVECPFYSSFLVSCSLDKTHLKLGVAAQIQPHTLLVCLWSAASTTSDEVQDAWFRVSEQHGLHHFLEHRETGCFQTDPNDVHHLSARPSAEVETTIPESSAYAIPQTSLLTHAANSS